MSIWARLADATAHVVHDAHLSERFHGLIDALTSSHIFDHGRHKADDHQVAFTVGVISLGAKMAKADGIVTRDEVVAFKEVFKVPEVEMQNVSKIFDLAKQDVHGYEAYADQLASLLRDNRRLLEDILEGLFHIALADGVFDPSEEKFLVNVAQRFGFTSADVNQIKARHVVAARQDPYEVLGIGRDVDNDTLRRHYHKLVLDNHPDKMIARGVPPEFVSLATKKIAAINAAYEEVWMERRA